MSEQTSAIFQLDFLIDFDSLTGTVKRNSAGFRPGVSGSSSSPASLTTPQAPPGDSVTPNERPTLQRDYNISLRRRMPASPSAPVLVNSMLPGSGTSENWFCTPDKTAKLPFPPPSS